MITSTFFSMRSFLASSRSLFSTFSTSPDPCPSSHQLSQLLLQPLRRTNGFDGARHLPDNLGKAFALRCRNPGEHGPVSLYPDISQEALEHGKFSPGNHIPGQVMAFPRMTARDKDAISALLQGLHNIKRVDPARAGNPDYPHVRGILDPADARQVGARVGTPVADDGNDLRFPALILLIFIHISCSHKSNACYQPLTAHPSHLSLT